MPSYRQRRLRALTLALSLSCSAALASTRVALVSTCGGQAGDNVLALAEVKLSAAPDIVLVERAEVQRILEEQKLNHCGLSETAQAVMVGKLLGVEVFAALETYPNSHETLGLVVFDAASGVRLLDEALPSGDLTRQAESLAAATQAACVKRERTRRDLRTVCVLSVRNAEFPSALDSLCESMGRMLERRLVASASLAVLERERLEQINLERSLPTDSPAKELLASLTLLELEFSRADQTNGAKATVFLTDGSGATLGKVQAFGNLEQTADLVESLLQKVTQAMNAAPAPQTMDRPREARRFRDEANFLIDQNQTANALQAAEAAYALDPNEKESRPLLARALCATASGLQHPHCSPEDLRRALNLASRGADLCLQTRTESPPDSVGNFFYPLPAQEAAFEGFVGSACGLIQGSDDESHREWTELQGKYRQLLLKRREQITAAASATPLSFLSHVWDLYWLIGEFEPASATSAAWTGDVVETLDRVLALVDKFGACDISRPGGMSLMFTSILYRLGEPTKSTAGGRGLSWNLDEADKVRLEAFFEPLKSHHDPLLRLYGMASGFAATVRKQSVQSGEITASLEQIKQFGRETIAGPPCQKSDDYRISVYRVLLDTIDLLPDPAMRRAEYQALFDFMLERHEYVHWVAMAAVDPQACTFATYGYYGSVLPRDRKSPGDPSLCAQNLARLHALLDSADCHKLIGPSDLWRGELDQELQRVRQSIAEKQPNLIPSSPAPWSAARLLYDGPSMLLQPTVVGDSVWGLESPLGNPSAIELRLVRVPLDGRPAHRYDRIPPDGPPDKFYAAPVNDGLAIFPPDAAAVNHLTEANRLPSKYVDVVARCDGKLYAGIGRNEGYLGTGYQGSPGYLIEYEPATGLVKVLASSLRKEKLGALDDVASAYFIRQMVADPARHRVLFTVDVGVYKHGTPYTGVWSVSTTDDKLALLLPLDGICEWMSQIHNGKLLFARRLRADKVAYEVFSFNLETDTAKLFATSFPSTTAVPTGSDHVYTVPWQGGPPHILLDGWLWVGSPLSRIPADGGPREFLPSFVEGPHINYGQLRSFEPLDNGRQLLVGVGTQLWLLDFKSNRAGVATNVTANPRP